MKQINRWGISTGLVALVSLAVFAASCSDGKKGSSGAMGGAPGTGGATSSSGGSQSGGESATGGKTSTSTSTQPTTDGGEQDSGPTVVLGCTSANTDVARTDGLIADFVDTGAAGIEVGGGLSTYSGDAAPDYEVVNGALHITQDAPQTTSDQYVGTVLYFNNCVDATAFTGVEFTISGTMSSTCTMQYSTNHSAANDQSTDPKGTCDLGPGMCYSPQKGITISDTETVVQVPWTGATGGSPNVAVDPAKLTGIQWQFTIKSGTGTCTADIMVKNIKFYK